MNHRACNVLSSKPEAGAVVREEGVVAGEQVHVGREAVARVAEAREAVAKEAVARAGW